MGENFNSEEMSLGNMIDGGKQYKTPPYQRKYSWKKAEYRKLFEDIQESVGNCEADATDEVSYYYIGTILLVKKPEESDYEIVDGQQRLVSISLLFAAIYRYIGDLDDKIKRLKNEDLVGENRGILQGILQERCDGIKKFLLTNHGNIRIVPQEQFGNKDDFIKILKDLNLTSMSHNAKKNHGNRIIANVYNYFYKEIKRYAENSSISEHKHSIIKIKKEINSVKNFLDGMRRISFVGLVAVDYANAYKLFETLNNRGKPLTAVDLIKNMIYAKFTDKTKKTNKNYPIWEKLVENLVKESRTSEINADRYFRDFYNVFSITSSKYLKVIATNKKLASKHNMIGIYEKIIKKIALEKNGVENLLKFLKDKSDIYNKIIYPHEIKNTDHSSEKNSNFKIFECCTIIQDVKVVAVNAFLLYLFNKQNNFYETKESLREIVELMAKFSVRRIVTDFPRTNTLDLLIVNLIKFCEKDIKILSADAIEEKLIDEIKRLPKHDDFAFDNLEDLTAGFSRLSADTSNIFIKTILTQLSNHNHNKNPADFEKTGHNFVVEHIMPQTLTDEWHRLLNGISDTKENQMQNKKKAMKIHKEWLHRIGNLTLITAAENGGISNNRLPIKQQVYEKRNTWLNSVECSVNGENFSAKESNGKWNSMNIENRTKLLSEELAKFYQFNSEKF